MSIKVLVTGANGQLGRTLKDVAQKTANIHWDFKSSKDLDITSKQLISTYFERYKLDFVVNCAAYTKVDKAEDEQERAYLVNGESVKYLAKACNQYNVTLIHISTDFIFDGKKTTPYLESDIPNPINVYGKSKLIGEQYVKDILKNYFIIRTSWIYSKYGKNFVKTMQELGLQKKELEIVSDQIGTPTRATDLAIIILKIINADSKKYGIYNYSNEGETNWYEYSKVIFDLTKVNVILHPTLSANYVTCAMRPKYSVLDKNKIKKNLQIEIPDWKDSLIEELK